MQIQTQFDAPLPHYPERSKAAWINPFEMPEDEDENEPEPALRAPRGP
jgi:hypothetical protein